MTRVMGERTRRSARFVAWVRAWRAGLIPYDDVADEIEATEDHVVCDATDPGHERPLREALAGLSGLHPDQVRLTRTHWNGPARVRGPAGTGKTVVGLHRATHFALRTNRPILFTSFVRTLPAVFAELAGAGSMGLASHHVCALRPDDSVWCRGRGLEGQLGNGFDMDSESLFVEAQLNCPAL